MANMGAVDVVNERVRTLIARRGKEDDLISGTCQRTSVILIVRACKRICANCSYGRTCSAIGQRSEPEIRPRDALERLTGYESGAITRMLSRQLDPVANRTPYHPVTKRQHRSNATGQIGAHRGLNPASRSLPRTARHLGLRRICGLAGRSKLPQSAFGGRHRAPSAREIGPV